MLKWGGIVLHRCLALLYSIMHAAERIATSWKTTPQMPTHKKGELTATTNYRPIVLMSNIYKNYERCVDVRIRSTIRIPDVQCAYRKNFGPLITLTRIQIVMDYCKTHNIDLYMVYVDFKQAFERVWRGGLLHRLWEAGVRGKLWRVCSQAPGHS
jgi:hypothetical protein